MFIDAKKRAQKFKDKPLIFIQSKDYHEGLVGLVAGRLAEEFHRPAVVVALGPEHAKGSIRSIKGFDAIEEIRKISDLVMEHGGHPQAAGFTADKDKLAQIQKKLEAAAAKLSDQELKPEIAYDCDLDLKEADWGLYKELEKFEPFGFGNPVPVFLAKQVKVMSFYPVGQENKHLKLKLQGETLKTFNAIAFGKGPLAEKLTPGQLVDITYSLEPNVWNGRKSLELKVKEIGSYLP
jgi:single-stranded-DNA-specific exonuclease